MLYGFAPLSLGMAVPLAIRFGRKSHMQRSHRFGHVATLLFLDHHNSDYLGTI